TETLLGGQRGLVWMWRLVGRQPATSQSLTTAGSHYSGWRWGRQVLRVAAPGGRYQALDAIVAKSGLSVATEGYDTLH
ncbi:MAG: hypothetical protein J7M15_01565, partial [Anaerolineae bacterium]|nr:hypothetical protein [Anaerolineae bacterium]